MIVLEERSNDVWHDDPFIIVYDNFLLPRESLGCHCTTVIVRKTYPHGHIPITIRAFSYSPDPHGLTSFLVSLYVWSLNRIYMF